MNPCYAQRAGILRVRPQQMDEPLDVCKPFKMKTFIEIGSCDFNTLNPLIL